MLGFRNLGNTCYLNSVLSILLNCPNFISLIESKKYKEDDKQLPRVKSACKLLDSFGELVQLKQQVQPGKLGIIQPGGILKLMFDYLSHRKNSPLIPFRQNDALECLSVMLDAFEEGTINKIDSMWKAGIVERQIIRKSDKKLVDTKNETQITWNVNVPNQQTSANLLQCFMDTFDNHLEEIRYKRDGDEKDMDYLIKRIVKQTPNMWFLSVIRWDMMQNKIMTPISVPLVFKSKDKEYRLRGVICHMGSTIPSGHYYSVVIQDDKAFRIDDDSIRRCPLPFPEIIQRHIYGVMYESS